MEHTKNYGTTDKKECSSTTAQKVSTVCSVDLVSSWTKGDSHLRHLQQTPFSMVSSWTIEFWLGASCRRGFGCSWLSDECCYFQCCVYAASVSFGGCLERKEKKKKLDKLKKNAYLVFGTLNHSLSKCMRFHKTQTPESMSLVSQAMSALSH